MVEKIVSRRQFLAVSAAALGGLALFGCSGNAGQASSEAASASSAAKSSESVGAASNSPSAAEASAGSSASEAATTQEPSSESSGGKVLVACFSATGNTRAVAEMLAAHLDADYFEIEPSEPYTAEDLDYGDETTRATAEQNDPSARPAVVAVPDFSSYDVVLLGHPIWWGKAPRLMCTLLESSDLSGKKVAEFCTSGSSGVEEASAELEELAPGADWVGARRFAAGASESEVAEWADSLNL